MSLTGTGTLRGNQKGSATAAEAQRNKLRRGMGEMGVEINIDALSKNVPQNLIGSLQLTAMTSYSRYE